jgi:hypothetical protein
MIVVRLVMIVIMAMMMMPVPVVMRMNVRMLVVMGVIMTACLARRVVVSACRAMLVHGQRGDAHVVRLLLDSVRMIVTVIMVMIVCLQELRIARLDPEDRAAHEGERHQYEAAQEHVQVKLHAKHQRKHVALPEPEAQTDHAEGAGKSDHAHLIDEITVAFVVMRMRVIMFMFSHLKPPFSPASQRRALFTNALGCEP